MSLLKVNEIQIFNGTTVTITATTTETSADLNVGADLDVTGALTLGTALAIAEGGTGATTASGARAALDLEIGVDVEAYSATNANYADATANFTGTLQNGGSNVLVDTDIGSTVQAYDATILKSADIGSTVQAYDADTAKYDAVTANFTGTLQNGGSNVVVDSDIGSTVQAYDADTTKNDVSNTFTANQIISVADNTNAALRITQTGTGNALVVEDSSNPDSTPFVVDASGNVGIGTSPDGLLNLKHVTSSNSISEDASDYALTFNFAGATGDYGRHIALRDGNGDAVSVIGGLDEGLGGATGLYLATGSASGISERMRITSSGNVEIDNIATIYASGGDIVKYYQNRDGGTPYWYFNTTGSYGVYSDERLKENITATEQADSVEFIKNLQAVEFNWKSSSGDAARRISGLIAQNVLASAKTEGQKNILTNWETYDENDPDCPKMGLSDHRMIPSIVQALQVAIKRIESQQSQIDALTARIEALEV